MKTLRPLQVAGSELRTSEIEICCSILLTTKESVESERRRGPMRLPNQSAFRLAFPSCTLAYTLVSGCARSRTLGRIWIRYPLANNNNENRSRQPDPSAYADPFVFFVCSGLHSVHRADFTSVHQGLAHPPSTSRSKVPTCPHSFVKPGFTKHFRFTHTPFDGILHGTIIPVSFLVRLFLKISTSERIYLGFAAVRTVHRSFRPLILLDQSTRLALICRYCDFPVSLTLWRWSL